MSSYPIMDSDVLDNYRVRAAFHGSSRYAPGGAANRPQIATETKVPIDYLFKVLQSLGRAGLVQAQRGKNGGFSLLNDPVDISIYDVVQAVDPIKRIAKCPLDLKAHGVRLVPCTASWTTRCGISKRRSHLLAWRT